MLGVELQRADRTLVRVRNVSRPLNVDNFWPQLSLLRARLAHRADTSQELLQRESRLDIAFGPRLASSRRVRGG